jgi:hypothetical protein|tara:strand:- start:253 stop:423 length:171 start_codon:yes stop_codon:yes gene_type:complete
METSFRLRRSLPTVPTNQRHAVDTAKAASSFVPVDECTAIDISIFRKRMIGMMLLR